MEARALVGRQRELEQVAEALASGPYHGVVVRGGAGAGKTRLALECLRIADGLGFATRRVTATVSARTVPLGAMATLVPPLGPEVNPLGAAMAAVRASAEGSGRLLLLVDDAQWLDDTSAALVHQIVAEADAFVLLTVRDGELAPDSVLAILREPSLVQVALDPLEAGEVAELVTGLLDGDVDPVLVERVVSLADGSPLAAHELVVGGVESGAVRHSGGRWRAEGPLERAPRVTELVAERVERLGAPARSALATVALAEPLPLEWVSPEELARLADLEAAGLVETRRIQGRDEIWVAHPLYGEVLRDTLSPLARRTTLAELVRTAGERPAGDDHDELRLVLWSLELGLTVESSRLRRVARRAFATHRFDLAARFLEAVPPDERDRDHRFDLMTARVFCDEHEAGDRMLDEIEADPVDEHEYARAMEMRIIYAQAGGDFAEARRRTAEALERITEPDERARIEAADFPSTIAELPPAATADVLEGLIGLTDEPGFINVAYGLSMARTLAGRTDAAASVALRSYQLHRRLWVGHSGDLIPSHPVNSLLFACFALANGGRLAEAGDLLAASDQYVVGSSSRLVRAHLAAARGITAYRSGHLRDAAEQCELAGSLYRGSMQELGSRWQASWCFAAMARAQLDELDRAEAALVEAERSRTTPMFVPLLDVARAWVFVARHRSDDAVAELARLVGAAVEEGHLLFGVQAAFGLLCLDAVDRVPPEVEQLAGQVDGELLCCWLEALGAARSGDAAGLESIGERLATAGIRADAAEVFAAASRSWVAQGRPRPATAAARRARDLAAVCGLHTPGVVLPEDGTALTDREREVAGLAARGTTARAIGEQLFISERTVTNHLQRVYAKLGVSSRAELRDALGLGD